MKCRNFGNVKYFRGHKVNDMRSNAAILVIKGHSRFGQVGDTVKRDEILIR